MNDDSNNIIDQEIIISDEANYVKDDEIQTKEAENDF